MNKLLIQTIQIWFPKFTEPALNKLNFKASKLVHQVALNKIRKEKDLMTRNRIYLRNLDREANFQMIWILKLVQVAIKCLLVTVSRKPFYQRIIKASPIKIIWLQVQEAKKDMQIRLKRLSKIKWIQMRKFINRNRKVTHRLETILMI